MTGSRNPSDTHREVRKASDGTRTLLIRRRYDSPVDDVWNAFTEPDRLNRWFLPVSGDLRLGGRFQLQGNAGGEILRCDPPHVLRVSWVIGDGPGSEVELRLAPTEDGDTILELEHGPIPPPVEMEGRWLDVILNDPQSGIWGLGTGWELPLVFALPDYLRGVLPDAPAVEWFVPTPEVFELADRVGAAWAAVVNSPDQNQLITPSRGSS